MTNEPIGFRIIPSPEDQVTVKATRAFFEALVYETTPKMTFFFIADSSVPESYLAVTTPSETSSLLPTYQQFILTYFPNTEFEPWAGIPSHHLPLTATCPYRVCYAYGLLRTFADFNPDPLAPLFTLFDHQLQPDEFFSFSVDVALADPDYLNTIRSIEFALHPHDLEDVKRAQPLWQVLFTVGVRTNVKPEPGTILDDKGQRISQVETANYDRAWSLIKQFEDRFLKQYAVRYISSGPSPDDIDWDKPAGEQLHKTIFRPKEQVYGFVRWFDGPESAKQKYQTMMYDDRKKAYKLEKLPPDSPFWNLSFPNGDELLGLVHLPHKSIESSLLLRATKRIKPVPDEFSGKAGLLFGENEYRGQTKNVRLPHDLRSRHTYIVGASGSGKSTLLSNLIKQDLEDGAGFALLDPHGDLVEDILPFIPEHRVEDVIYFDPTNKEHVMPINILAAQPGEEQLIADAVILTFCRLAEGWGPRMDYILRNAVYTLLATGNKTFADIKYILVDPGYRASVIQTLTIPMLQSFWSAEFPSYPKTATDPIANKFGIFLNPFSPTTHIFTQTTPTPDFFKIMQEKKVFLANLSQGQIGTETAQLLGTFLISQIQLAAMRRANVPPEQRSRFTLYVDEFQNYTDEGSAFEKMLSEARKYNLALVLANQYSAQLSGKVRDAIFGNVFTTVAFRVGVDDARIMQKAMPLYTPEDLQNFEIGEAVMRCGKAEDSFNLKTFYNPNKPETNFIDAIIEHSQKTYSIPTSEILEKQQQAQAAQQQPAPESEDDPY